ncbi:short transient receptor potential channel 5-like [Ptychodera flava]|uniref:short transient receptor potential channel 5-like n=1 Tax=Ptychodera flava TaxID=63121 RepID=UPI00396A80A6
MIGMSSVNGGKQTFDVKSLVYYVHLNDDNMSRTAKTPAEVLYLTAVDRGDKNALLLAFENAQSLNINCVDSSGRNALHIAIQNGNQDIVKMLLDQGVEIRDGLLHATDVQFTVAIRPICEELKRRGQLREGLNCRDSKNELHPDITPVVLAGHHNNYDILKTLLEYGAFVEDPDKYDYKTAEFTLEYSVGRINVYRALASQAYIALTSEDPISRAFDLAWKLRLLSERDYEFRQQYLELADQCEKFAADLLGQVRDTREQTIVLTHDPAEWLKSRNYTEPYKVKRALRLDQKLFVAHPHCQQHLIELWYQGLPSWRKVNILKKYSISALLGFAFPLLCVSYILAPGTKLSRLLKIPYLRFVCNLASSMTFLVLLSFQAIDYKAMFREPSTDISNSSGNVEITTTSTREVTGQLQFTDMLIIIYVLSYTWYEIQDIAKYGKKGVSDNFKWKLLDYMMLTMYWAWMAIRILAAFADHEVQTNRTTVSNDSLYEQVELSTVDSFSIAYEEEPPLQPGDLTIEDVLKRQQDMEKRLRTLIETNFAHIEAALARSQGQQDTSEVHRRSRRAVRRLPKRPTTGTVVGNTTSSSNSVLGSLGALHPILVADGIFAFAKVVSFLRVIRLTVVHLQVGPMQISLGRMTYDIVRFLTIFSLVWFAFSVGLNQLYSDYDENYVIPCSWQHTGSKCNPPPFGSIGQALLTLFWTLFGVSDLSTLKIIGTDHWYTEMMGQILYALYHVIALVVLLNILIAMMSNTYTQIEQDADIEWKYSRSRLWLSYYDKMSALAPPFNIFPTVDSFKKLTKLLKRKVNGNSTERRKRKRSHIQRKNREYTEIVQMLVQRYFFHRKRGADGEDERGLGGAEQYFSQIKLDMSNFKYDLLQNMTSMNDRMTEIQEQIDNSEKKIERVNPGTEIENALRNLVKDPSNVRRLHPLTQQTLMDLGIIRRPLRYADRYRSEDGEEDYVSEGESLGGWEGRWEG